MKKMNSFLILLAILLFVTMDGLAQQDPCPCGHRVAKFNWNNDTDSFEVDPDVGNDGVRITNVTTNDQGEPMSVTWESDVWFICAVLIKHGSTTTTQTFSPSTTTGTSSTPDQNAISNLQFCGDQLIAVELTSFAAQATAETITLTWATATETENLGFHVYRSTKVDGEYSQVNAALIPGAGNSAEAHNYSYTDRNVEIGTTYYYKLADVDFNGNLRFHGPVSATVSAVPDKYALQQNYPNPFNPETSISYSLKSAGAVKLTIINNLGQTVRMLVNANQEAGNHSVLWNSRDDHGQMVASGVYLYRLEVNGFSEVKKLVLSK